jgi:hypothetical protein
MRNILSRETVRNVTPSRPNLSAEVTDSTTEMNANAPARVTVRSIAREDVLWIDIVNKTALEFWIMFAEEIEGLMITLVSLDAQELRWLTLEDVDNNC